MKSKIEEKQIKLAYDIFNYETNYNFYELKDNYDSENEAILSILDTLQSEKGVKSILKYIRNEIENNKLVLLDSPNDNISQKMLSDSKKLFKDVNTYKKDMKNLENGRVI